MSDPEGEPFGPAGRVLVVALFVIYLVLLGWVVLWKLEVPRVGGGALRQLKLVPLVASSGAGPNAPLEVVANILLFVPFGLYLGILAPSWSWWKAAGPVAGSSLLLEAAQYVTAVGSADVTDLVVNTAGGLAGTGLLALTRRRLRAGTATVMAGVCSIGTVLALLAVGVFLTFQVRYGPPGPPPASTRPAR